MKDDRPVINWTPEMLERFRRAYTTATKEGGKDGSFTFDGNEFVFGYAKYLIEYLDSQFNKGGKVR